MLVFTKPPSLFTALVALLLVAGAAAAISDEELPIAERPPLELSVQLESKAAVGRAVSVLLQRQGEDGAWHQSPVLTSLALAALAQTPEAESDEVDQAIRQALSYLQAEDSSEPEMEVETGAGNIESVEEDEGREGAAQRAENGLSRQAETVLRIMAAVSGDEHPRLSDLAARALPAGHPPAALEAAVVTAVRMRESLAPDGDSRADLQSALQWACTYYTVPARQALDKRECRTFIYVLGRALRAVRSELPGAAESGDNWRRRTALILLNLQGGHGHWSCGNSKDQERDADRTATTASTAFALLLFGQVLNP